MAYEKTTWVDEVLAGAERFEILDNAGAAVDALGDLAQCQIVLETEVTTPGTQINAANLNNIEDGIEEADANASAALVAVAVLQDLCIDLKLTDSLPPLSDINPGPIDFVESSGAAPNPAWGRLLFDPSTDEGRQWNFILDRKYAGTPILKVHYYMVSASSGDVVVVARVAAISSGDSSVTAKVFAAANTVTETVPGAAGREGVISIPLANADSMAAGDRVILLLYRDADAGGDTAAGDMAVTGVELWYQAN